MAPGGNSDVTLRARLTLFFVAIVVLPMVAATVVLQALIGSEIERRSDDRLSLASRTAAAIFQERLQVAGRETRHVAKGLVDGIVDAALHEKITRAREEANLDFLVLTTDGAVAASSVGEAAYLEGVRAPTPAEVAGARGSAAVLRARVDVLSGNRTATVTGGFYADQELVRALARATRTDITLVSKGRPVASTLFPPPDLPSSGEGVIALEGGREALVTPLQGQDGGIAVVTRPEGVAGFETSLWLVVLGVLLLVSFLGYALANVIARPLQRLAAGAMAVAQGDFDTYVDAEGQGDVARLADAFNAMTENMRQYVSELERSRDELRHGLDRLGQSLRSTHDLEGMLSVILDTAAVTLGAKAGAVFLLSPTGRDMQLEVARGFHAPEHSSLRVGQGIAGRAAAGVSVLVPGEDPISAALPVEPAVPTAVAVPLIRGERTIGVLALYGRAVPQPFGRDDVATLGTFASQASVAIENVLLHQEAQRLSITDGLTGVWNRRYLQLTFSKEIERAQRFGRPLSLLMIDIDRFKDVNDEHGHQVGDEVLIELTRRVMGSIRSQIDSLIRYGGEEFVVVLPETPREGAVVVAEKIRQSIRLERFGIDRGEGIPVTVSIGVSSYPGEGGSADELIRAADLAMYRAKERGRNRVEAASPA